MPTDTKTVARMTAPRTPLAAALCALCVLTAACAGSGGNANAGSSAGSGGPAASPSPAAAAAANVAASPAGSPAAAGKGFTEAEVAEIKAILNGADPTKYRVILPEFKDGAAVGTMTLGTLPLTEVQRIASARGVETAASPHQGGSTVFPSGRGSVIVVLSSPATADANANTSASSSPTQGDIQYVGAERVRRLRDVLSRVDQSQYVFIY